MQKIATRIFIRASVVFGVLGIWLILAGGPDDNGTSILLTIHKLLFADIFIILPSFALSLAGKYLKQ